MSYQKMWKRCFAGILSAVMVMSSSATEFGLRIVYAEESEIEESSESSTEALSEEIVSAATSVSEESVSIVAVETETETGDEGAIAEETEAETVVAESTEFENINSFEAVLEEETETETTYDSIVQSADELSTEAETEFNMAADLVTASETEAEIVITDLESDENSGITIDWDNTVTEIRVAPYETVVLEVFTLSDESGLSYQWMEMGDVIESEILSSLEIIVTGYSWYCCEVSNGTETTEVDFWVYADTGLSIDSWPEVYVDAGDSSVLTSRVSTDVDCTLEYQWYYFDEDVDEDVYLGTEQTQVIENVTKSRNYYYSVADNYGNVAVGSVSVYVNNNLVVNGGSDIYVSYGDSTMLAVTASADRGELTYQWYKNWELIEGANKAEYTTEESTEYTYYICQVSDEYENTVNAYFYVHITNNLTLSSDLSGDNYVEYGDSITLNVTATADDMNGLSYEWYGSIETVSGEDLTSYTVSNITSYQYVYCRVEDSYGNYEYCYFHIYVNSGLTQESYTSYYEVEEGTTVTLEAPVLVNEGVSLTYEWYHNNTLISGATAETLTTDPITYRSYYECCVEDGYGRSVWFDYIIYVDSGLTIGSPTSNFKVAAGDSVTMDASSAVANEGVALTYQWYEYSEYYGYSSITGATLVTYTVDAIMSYSRYICEVTDEFGKTVRLYYYINVDNGLIVSCDQYEYAVEYGGNVSLSVSASANMGAIIYEWYYYANGYLVTVGDESDFELTDVTQSRYYYCEVSDEYQNSETVAFYVYVDSGLSIGSYMSHYEMEFGDSVTLDASCVTVDEGVTLNYQWYEYNEGYGFTEISGATSEIYMIDAITSYSRYECEVMDEYGQSVWLYYYIYIDNGFTVSGNQWRYAVEYGGSVTLSVDASANTGELSYTWYYFDDYGYQKYVGYDSSLELTDVTCAREYYCNVSDVYQNSEILSFYVYVDSGLQQEDYTGYYWIDPDTTVMLEAPVSVNEGVAVSYRWYKYVEDYGNKIISGAESDTYTTDAITSYTFYECQVTDEYGHSVWFYYYIYRQWFDSDI